MKTFKSTRKESFLSSIPTASIELDTDRLTIKCKFNFSYFCNSQEAGQDFKEWEHHELVKLFEKLKNYSEKSLHDWKSEFNGKYPVFVIYDNFPTKTDFEMPKNIPHQVKWARFHLENKVRLIGFVIPDSYHDTSHQKTRERFDKNTFYIVFLDKEHKFYITE